MNRYYNQNYTEEEIARILQTIKGCIASGEYQIALNRNRQENLEFVAEYGLNVRKQKEILMSIAVRDFCHSLQNMKPGYEHETLFVFVPQVTLLSVGDEEETVSVYTKFNIIERRGGTTTIVISFYKCNRPAEYLFR